MSDESDEYKYEDHTPLMSAVRNVAENGTDVIHLLIQYDSDVNASSYEGTSLHLAAKYGGEYTKETIYALIEAGADINAMDVIDRNALMAAIADTKNKNIIETIHTLIEKGININAQDSIRRTALMIAVLYGDKYTKDIIDILIIAGADIYINNKDDKTALDIAYDMAKKSGNFDMIDILQLYDDNWSFKWTAKNNIQLKLWSAQNIKIATTIILCWRNSYLSKIPWDLIREYILPMTIDRKDTIKLKRGKIH